MLGNSRQRAPPRQRLPAAWKGQLVQPLSDERTQTGCSIVRRLEKVQGLAQPMQGSHRASGDQEAIGSTHWPS